MITDNLPRPLTIGANARNDVLGALTILDFRELDYAVDCYVLPAVSHLLLNIPQTGFGFFLAIGGTLRLKVVATLGWTMDRIFT